jgi:two-component system nitrate/nitrite response regulator NarL
MAIPNIADVLTAREWEVAHFVSVGWSNKEIAQHLNLSEGTVKVHLHKILQKVGIKNRSVLAVIMLQYERHRAQALTERELPEISSPSSAGGSRP